jgi:hypothetical protein
MSEIESLRLASGSARITFACSGDTTFEAGRENSAGCVQYQVLLSIVEKEGEELGAHRSDIYLRHHALLNVEDPPPFSFGITFKLPDLTRRTHCGLAC